MSSRRSASSSTATRCSAGWAAASTRSAAAAGASGGPKSRRSSVAAGTTSSRHSTRSSPHPTSTRPPRRRPRPSWPNPRQSRRSRRRPSTRSTTPRRRSRGIRRRGIRRLVDHAEAWCWAATTTSGIKVGIDPVRMMTRGGTYYTLRCYLDDQPVFLGRNGRISVFGSERALARYLADEHDHDLSDLATYDDIRTAANDGSLQVNVTDENVYVLTGIVDDLADGPDAIDRDQLELAVELLRDVGEYAEDTDVDETLDADQPLGGWSPTCSIPTRSAARARRTSRPSSSGRRWRPSSNRGCGPSSATARPFAADAAMTFRSDRQSARYDPVYEPHHPFCHRPRRPAALRGPRRLARCCSSSARRWPRPSSRRWPTRSRATTPSSPTIRAASRTARSTTPDRTPRRELRADDVVAILDDLGAGRPTCSARAAEP